MTTYILGFSALYHDSAASLIIDGKISCAVQEERFTRVKHDSSFPINSIKFILDSHNISFSDINYIVFYDKPFLKFERILESYLSQIPYGFNSFKKSMPIWLKEKLFLKNILIKEFKILDKKFNQKKLLFSNHHFSHAASAFYPSPFNEAVVLTLDGVGEWATTTVAVANKKKLQIKKEINFPHSLGLLYSAFTYYCGFRINSGEYKLMGLAPYGKPLYKDKILNNLIDLKDDGSFKLNMEYFDYVAGLKMINKKFIKLFGQKERRPDIDEIKQFHMDIASSIQTVIEEVILKIVKNIRKEYNIENLCLAGGVALNCVANGKIQREKIFKNIWIQPASGDAGGSIGAALGVWHSYLKNEKQNTFDIMSGSYLGTEYSNTETYKILEDLGAKFIKYDNFSDLAKNIAKEISMEKAIGWFQGKMEFGPRALGNRSILADPRSLNMQKNLNLKIKFRESFRPFAPAILKEYLNDWFELDTESPYMLLVSDIIERKRLTTKQEDKKLFGIEKLNLKRSDIPSVTHVDYSARIQTVDKLTNNKFHELILEFYKITNCPILINTSFNVRGEPIVCSPMDAFNCFMGTDLDLLVVNNAVLYKNNQNQSLIKDYKHKYKLD